MIQDLCPSCGARCYSCDSLRVSLRCQAATNLAMRREQERSRDQYRADILRWANTERVGVALEELAEAPALDLRLRRALISDSRLQGDQSLTPAIPVDGTGTDARFDSERGDL